MNGDTFAFNLEVLALNHRRETAEETKLQLSKASGQGLFRAEKPGRAIVLWRWLLRERTGKSENRKIAPAQVPTFFVQILTVLVAADVRKHGG